MVEVEVSAREQEVEQAYSEAASAPPPETPPVRARMVEVTPAMAEKLLARNTHNRSVQTSRVDQYVGRGIPYANVDRNSSRRKQAMKLATLRRDYRRAE